MAHKVNCPHCGCPLLAVHDTVRVPEIDPVGSLHREIEHLRATIAWLRGAGSNPIRENDPIQRNREGSGRAG